MESRDIFQVGTERIVYENKSWGERRAISDVY